MDGSAGMTDPGRPGLDVSGFRTKKPTLVGPEQRPFSTRGNVAVSPAGLGADSGGIYHVVRCTLTARWKRRRKGGGQGPRRSPIFDDGNHAIRTIAFSVLARPTRLLPSLG